MSQLVDLLQGSKYARLTAMPANNGTDRTFSVREQSDAKPEIRQKNAVNFIDVRNRIQQEFTVDEAKKSLSTTGVSKSETAANSTFTDDAFGTYGTRAVDPKLAQYKSKLIQNYLATDTNKQYVTKNSTASGIVLGYTPA